MGQGPKSEHYRYSMKTVASLLQAMCTDKVYAYPVPPQNALTLERIFVHFKITFDSSVATGDRKITEIGISNTRPFFYRDEPTDKLMLPVNLSADANRVIDLKIDLSSLIPDKTAVDYDAVFEADYETGDKTFVYVKMPEGLRDVLTVGIIDIWKIDTVWTTKEIR